MYKKIEQKKQRSSAGMYWKEDAWQWWENSCINYTVKHESGKLEGFSSVKI